MGKEAEYYRIPVSTEPLIRPELTFTSFLEDLNDFQECVVECLGV